MAKRKRTKDLSTKHTYETKDRLTRTPLKTGGELRFSGRVSLCTYVYNNLEMPQRLIGQGAHLECGRSWI
jgi:hypothetical protein